MHTAQFETLILKRKQELISLLEKSTPSRDAIDLDQTKVGRLSRMDAMQIHEMKQETQRRMKGERQALDRALTRIEEGAYGECEECGDQINPMRLKIDLTAQFCIQCANRMENS